MKKERGMNEFAPASRTTSVLPSGELFELVGVGAVGDHVGKLAAGADQVAGRVELDLRASKMGC